jgi:cyclic pyranopterin phosphate synthase
MIEIHTDGSCLGNPGPGGWAAIILDGGKKRVLRGHEARTTNNRMEILAVVGGLRDLPPSVEVTVFSDSEYVVNTMTRGWKRRANVDLWAKLDGEVARRHVEWRWERGHAGNVLNEEADAVANKEAQIAAGASHNSALSHVDESGDARMVDVGVKAPTERVAVARGSVVMRPETLALIKSNEVAKGDVLGVARMAGVMAAKQTASLIPLCHPIALDHVEVDLRLDEARSAVEIAATARATARTGVEMEALTAVSVAGLTVYDMCKAVDRGIRIEGVRLVKKTGGKSGDFVSE